jgi:hypothetical protein
MQERGHFFQVFTGLKLGFDFGDVGQSLPIPQKRFLNVVEMPYLMLDEAGDEPVVIVGTLWGLGDFHYQFVFFFHVFPHTSKTQQSSSGRRVLVSGVRKFLEFFSRIVCLS